MNDAVHIWKALEHLAMDVLLLVALSGVRIYRLSIVHKILDNVTWGGHQSRSEIAGEEEGRGIVRIADRDMTVGIDDIMVMEKVVGRY